MLTILASVVMSMAHAETAKLAWPSRHSEVTCGGMVDGEDLVMRVITPTQILAATSKDERIMLYIDLGKPGQVRVVMAEVLTDEEYDKREAMLAKLAPEEADLIRKLTPSREHDIRSGFAEGYFNMNFTAKKRTVSVSCQEVQEVEGLTYLDTK